MLLFTQRRAAIVIFFVIHTTKNVFAGEMFITIDNEPTYEQKADFFISPN